MFSNPFNTKTDPVLGAIEEALKDGQIRREAEAVVNEAFGVYSRKAVVREHVAEYDAAVEEVYTALKEGVQIDETSKAAFEQGLKKYGKGPPAHKANSVPGKAKKDYDKDGKIESPKDEVWGSRLRAAKNAGKMEEEQLNEIGDTKRGQKMLKSYIKKADKDYDKILSRDPNHSPSLAGYKAIGDKGLNRMDNHAIGTMRAHARIAYEETEQLDELKSDGVLKRYHKKAVDKMHTGEEPGEKREKGRLMAGRKRFGGSVLGISKAKVMGTNEEYGQIDEVSKRKAITAYREREGQHKSEYNQGVGSDGEKDNDDYGERSGRKAEKTLARIHKKFGAKTADQAKRGAEIDDNGRKNHTGGSDYLSAKERVYSKFSRPNSKKGTSQRKSYMSMNKGTFAKEEYGQIDEVGNTEKGKQALGRYVKSASHDVATKSALTRGHAMKSDDARKNQDYMGAKKHDEFSNKMFNKSWKRREGIARAVDRMMKEEELDEVRKSYHSSTSAKGAVSAWGARAGKKPRLTPDSELSPEERKRREDFTKSVMDGLSADRRYRKESVEKIDEIVVQKSQMRPGETLGMAMNRLTGKTAIKGGANDPTSANFKAGRQQGPMISDAPKTASTSTAAKPSAFSMSAQAATSSSSTNSDALKNATRTAIKGNMTAMKDNMAMTANDAKNVRAGNSGQTNAVDTNTDSKGNTTSAAKPDNSWSHSIKQTFHNLTGLGSDDRGASEAGIGKTSFAADGTNNKSVGTGTATPAINAAKKSGVVPMNESVQVGANRYRIV